MTHTNGVISFSIEKLLGPGKFSPSSPPNKNHGEAVIIKRTRNKGGEKRPPTLNYSEEEEDFDEDVNIEESSEDDELEEDLKSSYTDERCHPQRSQRHHSHLVKTQTSKDNLSPSPYRDLRTIDSSPAEPFNLTDRLAGLKFLISSLDIYRPISL